VPCRKFYKEFGTTDFESFTKAIKGFTPDERYRKLFLFLQTRDPSQVTLGYRALAALCAEAYFDLVLTTNFDPLMDDALTDARLWRKDYLLLVNSVVRNEWLRSVLPAPRPRVKVVKLHGDLFHRAMAWTVKEMDTFLDDIHPVVSRALVNRDVLVVGHSLRDPRIRKLIMNARTVWFTHPHKAPDYLRSDNRIRSVIDPKCKFESLFVLLAKGLEVATEGGSTAAQAKAAQKKLLPAEPARAQTTDDFMTSVVAIEGPGGEKMSTGFVLADPRVIVTDGYPIAALAGAQGNMPTTVTVVTADGKRYHDQIVHRDPSHPFGVVLIEAFSDVKKFPGLKMNTSRPKAGTAVQIGVAAGERVGVSAGRIRNAHEQTIEVAPVGRVPHLIAVESAVAPGSSGAPVVDADLTVLGYIVAGGNKPPAFMYPSHRWAARLRAIQRGTAPRRGTTRKRTTRHR
jgi:S1-C subfamily serine protease